MEPNPTPDHRLQRLHSWVSTPGYQGAGQRTVFAAVCTCGRQTTNSANPDYAMRKIRRHADGDDRGMTPQRTAA